MTTPHLFSTSTTRRAGLLLAGWLVTTLFATAASSPRLPAAAKWERFEVILKSDVRYTNALQQATLDAVFVSPLGETNRVPGFWDGGRIWRVRFAPDLPGQWSYFTTCSDTANTGLHGQSGEFLCTAATDNDHFAQHGPLKVSRNHRYLEHADHTPFLWLGDAAWHAASHATPEEWKTYTGKRASQKFNAVQWMLSPGPDAKRDAPFTGHDQIAINVDAWKKLDAKVDMLNRAGLLSALAPLWEIGAGAENPLPEDQAAALFRYAVARWGGNTVAWIVAFEADRSGQQVARWQRIGRAVFGDITHAPVILLPGNTPWVLDEFRNEIWVDAFGFNTTQVVNDDALQWLLTGPLTLERRKQPARPLLTLAPPAETATSNTTSVNGDQSRHLLWWSLLVNTPAGVSYSAQDVAEWNLGDGKKRKSGDPLPPWQQALTLPGASAVAPFSDAFTALPFERLLPFSRAVAVQPGLQIPQRYIAAAGTEARDLTVFYVPETPTINVAAGALPHAASAEWFNPRTGERRPASAVKNFDASEFTTPGSGDWFLILKAGK